MLSNKNGRKMRHPYATLAIVGLAVAGAMSIASKTKKFVKEKTKCLSSMAKSMRYE